MLTDEAKALVMSGLFGSGCVIGLTQNGKELTDPGYERQPVSLVKNGSNLRYKNTNELVFGPWRNDIGSITGYLVAKSGVILISEPFADPRTDIRRADDFAIPAGNIEIAI